MVDTLNFYESNAEQFFIDTVDVDMAPLHERFLAFIPSNGLILDAGCGSGRDAAAFLAQGYRVEAFDASPSLAALASQYLGQAVTVSDFLNFSSAETFDGVWACASLLHVPAASVPQAISHLWSLLSSGGVLYCSFKVGAGEREHQGREFTDANESQLSVWVARLPDMKEMQLWRTTDARPERVDEWINALVFRS